MSCVMAASKAVAVFSGQFAESPRWAILKGVLSPGPRRLIGRCSPAGNLGEARSLSKRARIDPAQVPGRRGSESHMEEVILRLGLVAVFVLAAVEGDVALILT